MHGQYKQPGGKLIRVDLEVGEGVITDAEVSGDFFLYPEEAFGQITEALIGLPADWQDWAIAARIQAAIPPGTEWLGSSPESLATAVRRALDEGEQANG